MRYIYTTTEVGQFIQCSSRYVRELCKAGKIPGAYQVQGKRGKEWRIPSEAVAKLIEEQEVEAELLPAEETQLAPQEKVRDLIRKEVEELASDIRKELEETRQEVEEERKDKEQLRKELAETRKENEELKNYIEEVRGRSEKEVAEVKEQLGRNEEEVAELRKEQSEVDNFIENWRKEKEEREQRPWWKKIFKKD